MAHSRLAAVLFDMDGTLVDSEKVWDVALRELAAHYGGVLSPIGRAAMVGTATEETMEILHADLRQPWRDPVYGSDWLDSRVMELFADGLQWRPGARELLDAVRTAGLPTALVTNTRRKLADIALKTIGEHNFDIVVCGDEVPWTKPHPAPYAQAVTALGATPSECVAIEDSPAGIRSALDAGCVVVGVPSEVPLDGRATVTVPSLVDLDVALLRQLITDGAATNPR